jgi:hypothetical protein
MSNEVMTTTATDGLSGHTDDVAGQESRKRGLFKGARLKFGKTAEWEVDGDVIDPATRLILIDVARIVTRWGKDKKPLETMVLEPGEKFPDVEAWNDALPKSEWVEGMNGPRGPWQSQQIVYFVNPKTMAQYHWADGSVGGSIAIREAVESTKAMRRFRPGAAPVVELSSKHMNTKFGGRERPHFEILNWITLPGSEAPSPGNAALPAPPAGIKAVEPVSIAEELNDEIGF